jgi:two-component system response regulator AtoC
VPFVAVNCGALNPNLAESALFGHERGAFTGDLFYRLAVIEINVPPLRERGDDVVLLANHLIRLLNAEHGKRVEGLQPGVERLFLSYPWPGNVRELRNAIERSIVMGDVDLVTAEALPEAIADCDRRLREQTHPEGAPTARNEISLDEMNVAAIQRAIEQTGGNISEAARRLKISRGRLRYLLDKLKDGKSRGAAR